MDDNNFPLEPKEDISMELEQDTRAESTISHVPFTKDEIEKRKQKALSFLNKNKAWVTYIILAFITYIGVSVRIRNIDKLKDVVTGTWTLGPDLDPFLFLRWAEYIAENGTLFAMDMLRNIPLGFNAAIDMKLLSYMIVWLHYLLNFFSQEVTVTYAAIIFPVVMFGFTTIAFFLFSRKVFYKESAKIRNLISLIATGFFVLIPSLLPRTIAGIPEKESAAFFFIFMAFYFFLEAYTSKNLKRSLIFGALAGITTGLLALIWGGVTYVFVTIAAAVLFAFILGKIQTKEFYVYALWIIGFTFTMVPFSVRYGLRNMIGSTSTGIAYGIFFILLIDFILKKSGMYDKGKISKIKLPKPVISLLASGILLLIIVSVLFGPSFIYGQTKIIIQQTVHPLDATRWGLTVAENRQPYFVSEWRSEFGPVFQGVPLYFWLFFIGSVYLFNKMIKNLYRKERAILTFSYVVMLIALIFSRNAPNTLFDGSSGASLLLYFGGVLFFIICSGHFYYNRYKDGTLDVFKEFNIAYILYFIILTFTIVGARGAVRLIMVLGAVSPLAVAFLVVKVSQRYFEEKEETMKILVGIVAIIFIIASIFTAWAYYKSDKSMGENFAPGAYQAQWQKAMGWVRENTPPTIIENEEFKGGTVFAHWWDYGYWVQSIGERSTILDGGNAYVYWNHLMGRHVLTGSDEHAALEFLYTHDATHLLIDSTDIGKYTAYSSIGSNVDYDRFSWISTFLQDPAQIQETSEEIIYFYQGGSILDDDIIWEVEGREIMLPKRQAGIGGIAIKMDSGGNYLQPIAYVVYNGQQYLIPLRYLHAGGKTYDFESGLEAGIFAFPSLSQNEQGLNVNDIGAAFYLSPRTINSHLARLYLFGEETEYFKVAHVQSNIVVESMKAQGLDKGEFIYYGGFQGPIKIWDISYPNNLEDNSDYLLKEFPDIELTLAKIGEYN